MADKLFSAYILAFGASYLSSYRFQKVGLEIFASHPANSRGVLV